jgi:Holliday junction resolvase RusA-like endonuclease
VTPITFTVYGLPQPKGSVRAFMRPGGRFPIMTSDNPKVKAWQKVVGLGAVAARGAGQEAELGPVELCVTFYLARPQRLARKATPAHLTKPDVDKLLRAILDSMIGICFRDDSQVVKVTATKAYAEADDRPRATITVQSVERATFTHSPLLEAIQ